MSTTLAVLFLVMAALPAVDSVTRLFLLYRSRRPDWKTESVSINRWLVVVPARGEAEFVAKTLQSVHAASRGRSVSTLLLLDGDDESARSVAKALGIEVVVKEPSGPTKAAALDWLARTVGDRLLDADAVLVLDVGSTLTDRFFDNFGWPAGCDAVQARLSGVGSGVGIAAAASEHDAQLHEDRGRQSLGWSARLRGTGSAYRPSTFLDISMHLRTRIEDLEATLLMIGKRQRVALGGPTAIVHDDKPLTIYSAASQRARWLLGRYELLFKRRRDFRRAFTVRPLESMALFFEIFGRPLSLTVPFRGIVAIVVILCFWRSSVPLTTVSLLILMTAIADVLTVLLSGRSTMTASLRLIAAWLLAVVLTPRAVLIWLRAKRS